jgi:hypothetical protein
LASSARMAASFSRAGSPAGYAFSTTASALAPGRSTSSRGIEQRHDLVIGHNRLLAKIAGRDLVRIKAGSCSQEPPPALGVYASRLGLRPIVSAPFRRERRVLFHCDRHPPSFRTLINGRFGDHEIHRDVMRLRIDGRQPQRLERDSNCKGSWIQRSQRTIEVATSIAQAIAYSSKPSMAQWPHPESPLRFPPEEESRIPPVPSPHPATRGETRAVPCAPPPPAAPPSPPLP